MKKVYRGWKVLQAHTDLGYDPATDRVVCSDEAWQSFIKVHKECTHLRYEGLRNKELYYNIFKKTHAAGASGYGSVTMGGDNTPYVDYDFNFDNSGTHPFVEEDPTPSTGGRQANMRRRPDVAGPSRSRGSSGKRKQRDATNELQGQFCQLDDEDRRGIIDSVVNPQPPPAN
ncbi:hypothetical protein TIFTF001_007619 [Ficus carica]|uniref:Myb/SANT-like domain-containing protein n=1 Tax=Ficus carica TaxID=3494 RepID=A0AA88A6Z3_FICCA|nr:hypothetical protein TIFTF001_007619 [Ficus carica]